MLLLSCHFVFLRLPSSSLSSLPALEYQLNGSSITASISQWTLSARSSSSCWSPAHTIRSTINYVIGIKQLIIMNGVENSLSLGGVAKNFLCVIRCHCSEFVEFFHLFFAQRYAVVEEGSSSSSSSKQKRERMNKKQYKLHCVRLSRQFIFNYFLCYSAAAVLWQQKNFFFVCSTLSCFFSVCRFFFIELNYQDSTFPSVQVGLEFLSLFHCENVEINIEIFLPCLSSFSTLLV